MKNKKSKVVKSIAEISDDKKFIDWLKREGASDREKQLGHVMGALQTENLAKINDFLDLKIENPDKKLIDMMEIMGLIKVERGEGGGEGGVKGGAESPEGVKIILTDFSNILQYFPAYSRHKEYWDSKRGD